MDPVKTMLIIGKELAMISCAKNDIIIVVIRPIWNILKINVSIHDPSVDALKIDASPDFVNVTKSKSMQITKTATFIGTFLRTFQDTFHGKKIATSADM